MAGRSESREEYLEAIFKLTQQPEGATVGRVTTTQLREIAEIKMKDMNANDVEAAVRMLAGSAKSMGLTVVEG